jgi:major membrane immunogen (membrane-anchored lipoprotein)
MVIKEIGVLVKLLLMLIAVLMISCSTVNEVGWTVENGYVIVQLEKVNPDVETYYAEITLESGRRIAVEIGLPDENGKFRVKNNFGKFRNIEIYTNLDL